MPENGKGVVLNHDIVGLVRRLDDYTFELAHAVSAAQHDYRKADRIRISSYLVALRAYHAWVIDQPELDLPESHPQPEDLEPRKVLPEVENQAVADMVYLLRTLRFEMVHSQSARIPAGLNIHDSRRWIAVYDKVQRFLEDYVDQIQPLDLPESSPEKPVSPRGRLTI